MKPLLVSIDFEFNSTEERLLNLVSCSLCFPDGTNEDYWLHQDFKSTKSLSDRINKLKDLGYTFIAFNVVAEARACLSLIDVDPLTIEWYDLYLEWRCLTNHNNNMSYGKQYRNGKVITTQAPKPKWQQSEEDSEEADKSKPPMGLGGFLYKMLGVEIDNVFKESTRDLIISRPDSFTDEEKKTILTYGASDTKYLIPAFLKVIAEYKRLLGSKFNASELASEMKYRANYAVRTAIMERDGYPINVEWTKNFSDSVTAIIWRCQEDINNQFPDRKPFHRNKKQILYSLNEAAVREEVAKWIESQKPKKVYWTLTDSKKLSLSLKAFKKHFNYKHDYPEGNYFAQIVKYLTLKQNLNGFSPTSKNTIWDSVGSDGYVRPYMGIYGAQSARSQPKATSFIPLKSAWMRCLIEPKEGECMIGIDWASQEFMLSGLEFKDMAMIEAYESGDVYLGYLKAAGRIPKDATKATHRKERDDCKPVVLGLSYDMTEHGLAKDLTEKWGRPVSEAEALREVNMYKKTFRKMFREKEILQKRYRIDRHLKLPDGWYMWGDNINFRSVGNVRIQGSASCIMRKAVALAQDSGLIIAYTLHDAIYIRAKIEDRLKAAILLAECMDQAVRFFYPEWKERATIRLDCDIWSPELSEEDGLVEYSTGYGVMNMPFHQSTVYIDERGARQYEQFKKYFLPQEVEVDTEGF